MLACVYLTGDLDNLPAGGGDAGELDEPIQIPLSEPLGTQDANQQRSELVFHAANSSARGMSISRQSDRASQRQLSTTLGALPASIVHTHVQAALPTLTTVNVPDTWFLDEV